MNSLESYVKIYPALDDQFCKKIISELKEVEWQQHQFYDPLSKTYGTRNGNKELDITWDSIESKKELTDKVWKVIKQYIVTDLNKAYFDGWSGFTNIRFNKYKKSKLMDLHCDHIHSMFDGNMKGIPILSVLGLLNDDYEGGKFLMFDEQKEFKFKTGDIMIFPSVFLYPHRVTPVTKGTRHSFVSWVW
jgi:predicted 2-oxoglutarate/Fe(II)-dependent dioxygenase YbiX